MKVVLSSLAVIMLVASLGVTLMIGAPSVQSVLASNDFSPLPHAKDPQAGINNPDRCFQAGKDNGRDSGFSQSEFDTCGSSYEHGFMKGCLSVDGNTRDVCNSAEDAG